MQENGLEDVVQTLGKNVCIFGYPPPQKKKKRKAGSPEKHSPWKREKHLQYKPPHLWLPLSFSRCNTSAIGSRKVGLQKLEWKHSALLVRRVFY